MEKLERAIAAKEEAAQLVESMEGFTRDDRRMNAMTFANKIIKEYEEFINPLQPERYVHWKTVMQALKGMK